VKEPLWLDRRAIIAFHSESLAEHGGSSGIRDEGLLDSALARPKNQFAYAAESDIARPAAAHGFGLAKNHAFVDGNKRIAFIATATFLRLNGCRLTSSRMEEIQTMLAVAAGELTEEAFATWIHLHSQPTA